MKIWLLEEGERTGPHDSFELRERIEAGDLGGSTQAWYEGAPDWVRLDEVPVLASLFTPSSPPENSYAETEATPSATLDLDEEEEAGQAVLDYVHPPQLYMVRRFFARFFDVLLYLNLVVVLFGDPKILLFGQRGVFWHLGLGLCYVFIDAGMTHCWKCSPGKWLFGVRVVDSHGMAISLGGSIMRSLRVWVLGLGMWLITGIALAISWFMAKRLKYFIWDFPKRYRVVCEPLGTAKIIAAVAAFLTVLTLPFALLPMESFQELVEEVEKLRQ